MCLGVFERWSSPRMTWVISIAASSTTTVKWYSGVPSRADDDEVAAEVADVELDVAADDVVEGDDALADAEAERAAPALGLAGAPLLGRQVRAPPDVARRLLGRLLGLAVGVELLGRAVAGVGAGRRRAGAAAASA